MTTNLEIWKDIPGKPNYQISSFGRARRKYTTAVLRPLNHNAGYVAYALSHNGVVKQILAHRAVAMAFRGPPPFPKAEAAHNDGNPKNNYWKNIHWKTAIQNAADRDRHGRHLKGEQHPNAKLTPKKVIQIRRLRKLGWTYQRLTEKFLICMQTAQDIVNFKMWKHLGDPVAATRNITGEGK